ncbi:hypothetical protein C7444_101379 [Sphaerotilus hippei]|uniref:Uncharacterized protein n=1 Tax=Sphaerotilus hippei TaxID=744406 RepID=A0A318HE31_9BURK|nr:hypothetical protein [Sphaerotilus hippei]PXW99549.1 hypothetical protein C7444_101379 [Sphaerotilus hippei]
MTSVLAPLSQRGLSPRLCVAGARLLFCVCTGVLLVMSVPGETWAGVMPVADPAASSCSLMTR